MTVQDQDTKCLIKNILLASIISLVMYWLWSRRNLYRFASRFPGCYGLPVVGSFYTIKSLKAILQSLDILFERCKSNTMCVWAGYYPIICSSDPEFIEKVLSSSELLNKAKVFYNPLFQLLKGGLIASPEPIWRHNRKIINPCFNHKLLISFLPNFHKGKNKLLSKFDKMVNSGEYKLYDMIQRITLAISMETTMGQTVGPDDEVDGELLSNFRFLMEKVVYHLMLSCLNLGPLYLLYFKYQSYKKRLYTYLFAALEERLKKFNGKAKNETEVIEEMSVKKSRNIFIDQAIKSYQQRKLTLNDVVVESNNIVAASFETTANAVFCVLVMLATHPSIQERLYEEIVNIFPEKEFEIKFEHLKQLPYLDMVIKETLRLAPSVPFIGRHVMEDTVISKDLVLPKDLQIIISIFHVHRRKDIWGPNANSFNPDNFLPENMARKHLYAYIPFSKGMRNCIGWRYALIAMKVILAGVVRNYRFTTSTKYEDIEFTYHIGLKYLNEPSFKVYRRE